uniref:Sugar phosphate transporter domain-containing protein n=1 Tax=Rhodosorus marinus TaxID=101924 RepID=A0A7S3EKG0_9RHOD|mmetsp:Transcript_43299/g.169545  ORF Transcript_43299/g.169545 Transcript_43299/m.169545 type:complete len:287 (+) Transcript_43299:135-995(+)
MGTGTGRIEGDGQRDKRDQVRLRREAEKMPANMDTEQVSEREQPKSFVQKWISAFDLSIASAIFFNFFTSTGIVSANKFVYQQCNFTYATTLTFIHFIFTTLGLLFCLQVHLFEFKKLDIKKSSWLAFVGMGFVVFSNLSLQYNSLGFYQVMKHMTVAAVVVIEAVVYKKYLDKELVIPLLLVIAGVSLTGATDFKLNMIGVVFAVLNILCTSFYQIWCASLQKSLEANALQLQLYTAPLSALFIIPFVPILDNLSLSDSGSLFQFEMTARTAVRTPQKKKDLKAT